MRMNTERWESTTAYAHEVFGVEPPHIRAVREAAEHSDLPTWAINPDVGRLLSILASTTAGRRALEIGTLGGYSTMWLLEGMQPDAKVITIEYVDAHADHSEAQFAAAGVGDKVEVRRGAGLDLLPGIAEEFGPESLDIVFIDADKESNVGYYEITSNLVAPGGLLLVDNIYGTGSTWITDLDHPGIAATDQMNRMAAADARFESVGVFVSDGLLVARRR